MSKKILINQTGDNPTRFLAVPASTPTSIHTDTNQLAGVTKAELDAALATPVDSRPYKVYTAVLTQSGIAAPVATVLENTLGGEVIWTRDGVGVYFGTLEGAFPSGKCVPYCQYSPMNWNAISFSTERKDDDSVVVNLEELSANLPVDISYTGYSVYTEIRVYN